MKNQKSTGLLTLIALFAVSLVAAQRIETPKNFGAGKARVKVALNAYSFSGILNNYVQDKPGDKMSLFDLIDFCAVHDIEALDVTGYFFLGYPAVPSDEYIYAVKQYAHKRGVDISGTGIRNNFAHPDPARRAADVKHCKEWIDVASKLGAPVIRVFSGPVPTGYEEKWEEAAGWVIECLRECAEYAATKGVLVGVQNHGDMLRTADQVIYVLERVGSPWAGTILDTGYFLTDDPYEDMEKVLPYTVNWQVKESAFGKNSDVRIDLKRIMKMVRRHDYRGYLPIETLAPSKQGAKPYDPYTLVPAFAREVQQAIDAEFSE